MLNLVSPYNLFNYKINVILNNLAIKSTVTSASSKLEDHWFLVRINDAYNVTMKSIFLISNY